MLRALRFVVFAAALVAGLALNAGALRGALAAAAAGSPVPHAWTAAGALALLALGFVYGAWLAGATFARWRMPHLLHLAPLAVLALSIRCGPLPHRPAGPLEPRALAGEQR